MKTFKKSYRIFVQKEKLKYTSMGCLQKKKKKKSEPSN